MQTDTELPVDILTISTDPPVRRLFTYNPSEHLLEMDIDNTSLEHFTTCARSAEYRLVASREGTWNMAAKHYGSAKHHYLECRLRGGTVEEAEKALTDFLLPRQSDNDKEWRTVSHAIDSMRGYERFWHSMPITPVMVADQPLVEIPFRLPLCDINISLEAQLKSIEWLRPMVSNPDELPENVPPLVRVFWTGRIDTIAPFLTDNYVWDHKTTSMAGPTYYDDFQLSSQTQGYVWAAGHLYPDLQVKGLRVNTIIGRAPTRTGVAHAYERQTYIYSDAHLAEWHRDTQLLVADFIAHLLRSEHVAMSESPTHVINNYPTRSGFPKMTKWCQGKYGQCQYFSVCTAQPMSRHIVLGSDQFQDVTWSPLNPR